MLAVVVGATIHFGEAREFLDLVERAQPWWLAAALLLQALTYVAQGEVFLASPHAAGCRVPRRFVYELSLTKLFLDQAVPSAGLASTAIVANALERQGIPRGLTAAGAILNIVSYHSSYVVMLIAALGIMATLGRTSAPLLSSRATFHRGKSRIPIPSTAHWRRAEPLSAETFPRTGTSKATPSRPRKCQGDARPPAG